MRLLFARRDLALDQKACAVEVSAFLLQWLVVLAVTTGQFGEHFARSWVIAFVLVVMPINKLAIHWAKRLFIALVVGGTTMAIQGYIAYEMRGYSPTDDVSNVWTLAALVAYFAIAGVAWAAGRYFSGQRLHATGF